MSAVRGSDQRNYGAVVNWLSNNSVSIVDVDDIPTEARQEKVITHVRWGSATPVAKIVKISRSESDLERTATQLCEDIEAMEKQVILKHKRPPKPNKKFRTDGASEQDVAREVSGGTKRPRKKLTAAQTTKKKELTREQKVAIALQSQMKKKKEEELLLRFSKDPSTMSRSKKGDEQIKSKEEMSTHPSSVAKKLFQHQEATATTSSPAADTNPIADESESEPEVEVEDDTVLKQAMLFKFVKEYASSSTIRFLKKMATVMEDILERPKQIYYIPLKKLEAGQAVEYIGNEPNQVPITKKSKLSVEFAAASYVARLDALKKGNKKEKINILAPTKAAVRKLLTELFSDEELKNVTVKGTGKSKKAIPEHVLMAMYQYIDEITPEGRKISLSDFSKVILKKGGQLGDNQKKKPAGISECLGSTDEDNDDDDNDQGVESDDGEEGVENEDGIAATNKENESVEHDHIVEEDAYVFPDVALKRTSPTEPQETPRKKQAVISNTGSTPQKPMAMPVPVCSPLKKNKWVETFTAEVVTSQPQAPAPSSVASPGTASTAPAPDAQGSGSNAEAAGTSVSSAPANAVPQSYWGYNCAPSDWCPPAGQQYHQQQQSGPPPPGWQPQQQPPTSAAAWQHQYQQPAPPAPVWPQQQPGPHPPPGWHYQWQQQGPAPPSQWGPPQAWQPPAVNHTVVSPTAHSAEGEIEQS